MLETCWHEYKYPSFIQIYYERCRKVCKINWMRLLFVGFLCFWYFVFQLHFANHARRENDCVSFHSSLEFLIASMITLTEDLFNTTWFIPTPVTTFATSHSTCIKYVTVGISELNFSTLFFQLSSSFIQVCSTFVIDIY